MCTHAQQVDELRALLAPRYGAALEIGSVDGFQGREKEAVGACAAFDALLPLFACSVLCFGMPPCLSVMFL